jgi:hypothetical protein
MPYSVSVPRIFGIAITPPSTGTRVRKPVVNTSSSGGMSE